MRCHHHVLGSVAISVLLLGTSCGGTAHVPEHPTEPAHPAEPAAPVAKPDPTLRGYGSAHSIVQVVTMTIKPEREQEFVTHAYEAVRKVYEDEPGTLTFILTKHPTEPHTYVWIERYADAAAKQAHGATADMAETKKLLPGWFAKPPTAVIYEQVAPQ